MDILQFIKIANRLKGIKRRGWSKIDVKMDAESVADHSYQTALITMLFADLKGYDACKAVRLALLHDLAEAIVGDYMPEEIDEAEKHREESNAMERLLLLLPEELRDRYKELWYEYIGNSSKEADLVHQIDKFEMIIQADVYKDKGYQYDKLKQFYKLDSIKDKHLLSILNNLK